MSDSDPKDCSTSGFPVLHPLLEFAQIHVHWVGDTTYPKNLNSSKLYISLIQLLFFLKNYLFIWLCWVLVAACGIPRCGMWDLAPQPRIKPSPPFQHWEHRVWATGLPGKSLPLSSLVVTICSYNVAYLLCSEFMVYLPPWECKLHGMEILFFFFYLMDVSQALNDACHSIKFVEWVNKSSAEELKC